MENLNIRKLQYKKENWYSDLGIYLYYGICRINSNEEKEFTSALKELGIDKIIIAKDIDNKIFVIEEIIKKEVY